MEYLIEGSSRASFAEASQTDTAAQVGLSEWVKNPLKLRVELLRATRAPRPRTMPEGK